MPTRKSKKKPEQEGDVLGISHSKGTIPHPHFDDPGHPAGIEIDSHPDSTPGLGDVPQRPGATSIDMGGGGEGNDVRRKR